MYLLSEGGGERAAQLVVWGHREEFSWQLQEEKLVKLKAGRCLVYFCELIDLEIFLHIDLKRQQILDFAINHLCNIENSPVKLFYFSGKLKYLALLDQILVYSNSI